MVAPLMKYIKKIQRILQRVSGNAFVREKILEKNPGTFTEKRRNFDVLVIGDKYDVREIVPEDKMYLQFDAPDRNLFASYLILRGKFSWLKEGEGKCIIVCKKTNEKKKNISMFDIPFLHTITINKFNLKKQQTELKYPMLFHPFLVLKFLFGRKYDVSSVELCPLQEIEDFCKQRDIELEYRMINK